MKVLSFELLDWCELNLEAGQRKGSEFSATCPFCGDTERFSVNHELAKFRCFRSSCDRYGHAAQVIAHVEGITLAQAFKNFGEHDDHSGPKTPSFRAQKAPELTQLWSIPLPSEAKPVERLDLPRYLHEVRGLELETIKLYDLHYVHSSTRGPYAGYVILPVRCPNGFAFLAREALSRSELLRYRNAPGKWASDLCFGWEQAQLDGADLVLVEGSFDAMKLRQFGINAIALLGKELHSSVRRMLQKVLPRDTRIIVMLDAGEHEATNKLCSELWARFKQTYIAKPLPQLPNFKVDAGNATIEQAYESVDQARKFGS